MELIGHDNPFSGSGTYDKWHTFDRDKTKQFSYKEFYNRLEGLKELCHSCITRLSTCVEILVDLALSGDLPHLKKSSKSKKSPTLQDVINLGDQDPKNSKDVNFTVVKKEDEKHVNDLFSYIGF